MSVKRGLKIVPDYKMENAAGINPYEINPYGRSTPNPMSLNLGSGISVPWDDLLTVDGSHSASQVSGDRDELNTKDELKSKMDLLREMQELEREKLRISQKEEMLHLQMQLQGDKSKEEDNPDDKCVEEANQVPTFQDPIKSIVMELKKPKTVIKKFGGNIMEYRKFMKQFVYQAAVLENYNDKLNLLEQSTYDQPNRIVNSYINLSDSTDAFHGAMNELKRIYGDDRLIVTSYYKRALDFPDIRLDSKTTASELFNYSLVLSEVSMAVSSLENIKMLEYPDNLSKLVRKLPQNLHGKWWDIVDRRYEKQDEIKFEDLVSFVKREARKANDPFFGKEALSRKPTNPPSNPFGKLKLNYQSHAGTEINPVHEIPCVFCKSKEHSVLKCRRFTQQPCSERKTFMKPYGLCYGCLKPGHGIKLCTRKETCDICKRKHPTLYHDEEFNRIHQLYKNNTVGTDNSFMEAGYCTMNIIPVLVRLKGSDRPLKTYAFLDCGSTITFCTLNLMHKLGVDGTVRNLSLNTMGRPFNMKTHVLRNLEVLDLNGSNVIPLPTVYTKDKMPVEKDSIPTNSDIKKWKHLEQIYLHEIDAEIGILIGNNIPDAYTPLEVVRGPTGSPHASRTKLGWSVWNVIRDYYPGQSPSTQSITVNRCEIRTIKENENLEELVHKAINMDFPEKLTEDKREPSIDDKIFIKKTNGSITHLDNGHYQIDLPFKSDNVLVPNNRPQAVQRFKYLERKLTKNQEFKNDYVKFMDNIISNKFAIRVPEEDLNKDNGKIWYLIHHGTYHPRKKKIRVVYDLSAKYQGVALNQLLLSGPDLSSKLIGVLLRFCLEPVALMADITSMYYMVYVSNDDTDYQRFLWYPESDLTKPPVEYKMLVHLFGATSSASCAISALQKTAREFQTPENQKAAETILKNFYVDDCLKSVPTIEDANVMVKDLIDICSKGGFNLSKWMSNKREVLENIPNRDVSKEAQALNLDLDALPVERTLGIYWHAETDRFGFQINLPQKPATKRGILSTISSIYDPLGFAAPLILPAKIIMQNICKLHLQWDEEIPSSLLEDWNKWLEQLPNIEKVSLQRCYKPADFGRVKSTQLHCLSDASESGYGAVIYLRQINEQNQIHCSLVLGKSRVAPIKKITIPRMELTAATISVRLSRMVIKELEINLENTDIFYWTDSYSVLRYLANTTTKFQTFVANRIEVIRDTTELSQWKYVDSKANIADDYSRGQKCNSSNRWLNGPKFLWNPMSEWPLTNITLNLTEQESEEVKKTQIVAALNENNIMNQLIEYPSTWLKLKKIVAWILIGMTNLKEKIANKRANNQNTLQPKEKIKSLTVDDLLEAERRILIYIQHQHFSEEIDCIKKSIPLKRNSKIKKLDPYLEDDILRVGGRLQRSHLSDAEKHPIILPKNSRVSDLILNNIHITVGHLGRNSILAKLREKYWIVQAGTTIRNILSKCTICRHYRGQSGEQKMSDLPLNRLIPDEPLFTATGVDYFGPYLIKQGRSFVKRYGVIFTCLRSRAVHIEMAYSLDTDACINAIRRFTNRRGPVKTMKSDNGSNFIASNRELKEEFKKLDHNRMQHLLLNQSIKWEFNPPTASHFGGIWERQIRTIRKILFALMKEQTIKLSDDALQTLFVEIENIMNSRPITRTSEDPNDLTVLTPNNLLLFENTGSFPLGTFLKTDNFVRRKWRQVQYISDIFWKRWSSEYLSSLQERQKWLIPRRNFQINDIVLLIDDTVSRNSWCMGRITNVMTDKNGLVRTVKVKSKTNIFERPIAKLCLLLEADEPQ